MRATIKDVAREAGVSVSTVSYALSRKGKITKDSHRRVLEAAEKLGYVPDAAARSLVNSRMDAVGVIMPNTIGQNRQDPFYVEVLSIFSEELARRESWMNLYIAGQENREVLSNLLIDAKVDGVVWANIAPTEQETAILNRRNLPSLLMTSVDGKDFPGMPKILIDDEVGMHQAVKYLRDIGHKKIMLVSGSRAPETLHHERRVYFYSSAMDAFDLKYRRTIPAGFSGETAYEKMKEFIESGEEMPTAIISSSDSMAIGVIRALQESGLSVPGDVSVVGYDDVFNGRYMQPALSTIRQNMPDAVSAAIDFIFKCRDEKKTDLEFVKQFDTEFVLRESSGPAKKG